MNEEKALIDDYERTKSRSLFTRYFLIILIVTIIIAGIICAIVVPTVLLTRSTTCMDPPPLPSYGPVTYPENKVLLKNGNVFTGFREFLPNHDIFIKDGRIEKMGPTGSFTVDPDAKIYDLKGYFVTPGLIDAHSHLGVYSFPETNGHADGNEMTNPTTPMVRAIDAIRPNDKAIPEIAKGGVTTSLVLPGSGNMMGGQGVALKTIYGNSLDAMIIKDQKIYLKMACGENPKRYYGGRGEMPMSRMGNAWVIRQQFQKARELLEKQRQWDCDSRNVNLDKVNRPTDLTVQPLVHLLRDEAILHWHCYEVVDLEMAMRVAEEFNFTITAFHHASEAYKIPEKLREKNISVSIFADHWGFKMESYEASPYAPKILDEAGVNVILKSDHPVTHAKYLIQMAQMAHFYGMNEYSAIAAVTSNPARALKLDHRIGSIEVGKDGDIVVWDRHPLRLGASTVHVFIEGNLIASNDIPPKEPIEKKDVEYTIKGNCTKPNYAVIGATVHTMTNRGTIKDATITVKDGKVSCIGVCEVPDDFDIYELKGGHVIPGIIQGTSTLGLVEVAPEPSTNDGVAYGISTPHIRALDGIFMDGKALQAAWNGGVTASVSYPMGGNLISGISTAFYTFGKIVDDSILKKEVSVLGILGNSAKISGTEIGSVSGQIAYLRNLFQKSKSSNQTDDPIKKVLDGELKFCVVANKADHIGHILRLKKEFGFKLVIIGGAEAHLLAEKLTDVEIILTPRGAPPYIGQNFEILRTNDMFHIRKLLDHKIKIGLGINSDYDSRHLRFIAGLAAEEGMTQDEAIALITKNIAEIYGLDAGVIEVGKDANFVLFDENPISFYGNIKAVALREYVECRPRHAF